MADDLVDYFASLLRVPREGIAVSVNVLDLGADSIMLLEARTWIEGRYGHRIEIRRFFEDLNTIEAIAAFLAQAGCLDPAVSGAAPSPQPLLAGPDEPRAKAGLGAVSPADIRLMRSQLALVAETIEAQNRVAGTLRRRNGARTASEGDGPEGRPVPARRDAAAPMHKSEVDAA